MSNILTSDVFTATAKRVTEREVGAARLAPDYAALVLHYGLTSESDSALITDAARNVVCTGAAAIGTRVALAVSADPKMLAGSDPGADAAHRDYWKAARAVRIGLVTAIGKGEPEAKEAALRVTLSGEGGGSATVDMDSDLGKALLAFLAQGK